MANVLPQDKLQGVWRFYRARFIIVGSIVSICVSLIALAVLAPSMAMLWSVESSQDSDSGTNEKIDEAADKAEVERTHALISVMGPVAATTSVEGVIERIVSRRPKGISITRIAFSPGKQTSIALNGATENREAINTYQKMLQADPAYSSVTVPLEDLVGSGNTFSMTIVGTF